MNTAFAILILTNALRGGEMHVELNDSLSERAQARAQQLCEDGQWSHDGWVTSFEGTNSGYIGENLARNWNSSVKAFNGWVNSPSHYANLIKPEYNFIGVGEAKKCDLIVALYADKV